MRKTPPSPRARSQAVTTLHPDNPLAQAVGLASASACFEQWVAERVRAGDFDAKTVYTYRTIWRAYLLWLTRAAPGEAPQSWTGVNAALVTRFLQGPAPGLSASARPAIDHARMSNYTRQRYWRVLRGVYASACAQGLMATSPMFDVPETDRPHIERRSRQSQILPPGVLQALQAPATIARLHECESSAQWWRLRDRAIVAVLAHLGLTTRELAALRGQDVRCGHAPLLVWLRQQRSSQLDWIQALAQHRSETQPIHLDVMGEGRELSRALPIPAAVAQLLLPWLATREQLLTDRTLQSVRTGTASTTTAARHARKEPAAQAASLHGALFLSRQRRALSGAAQELCPLPPMDETSLYHVVKRSMAALAALPEGRALRAGLPSSAQRQYIAKGAAIVRNSLIRQWLDTHGPEEAARLAGLQSSESLRLHAPPAPL